MVDYSVDLKRLAQTQEVNGTNRLAKVRRIAGHTFYQISGQWIDAAFDKSMIKTMRKLTAFSDDYFALVAKHPDLNKVFAFGSAIVIVLDGVAIEISTKAK